MERGIRKNKKQKRNNIQRLKIPCRLDIKSKLWIIMATSKLNMEKNRKRMVPLEIKHRNRDMLGTITLRHPRKRKSGRIS